MLLLFNYLIYNYFPSAIYPVEKLLYYLKIVSKDGKFKSNKGESDCRRELVVGKSGYNLEIVKSSDVKNYSSLTKLFESMKYDLEVPLCGFHQELDNHYHCALANARKRVFVFYEKCCPVSKYLYIVFLGLKSRKKDSFKNSIGNVHTYLKNNLLSVFWNQNYQRHSHPRTRYFQRLENTNFSKRE